MIYIDINDLEEKITEEWRERARTALEAVRRADDGRRAVLINSHSTIWRDLKNDLADLSDGKCWCCESRDIRSDNAVDHFRPKNAVKECKGHPGYWWLAFAWTNYRYTCTFCNSRRVDEVGGTEGGKSHHFPLLNEKNRADSPNDDLTREEPVLLDPTDPGDPGLLWFNKDGAAAPVFNEGQDEISYARARESIHCYHLNHRLLAAARKKIAIKIRRLIRKADNIDPADGEKRSILKEIMKDAIRLIKRNSPFSAAARAYLSTYRAEPWVDRILSDRTLY